MKRIIFILTGLFLSTDSFGDTSKACQKCAEEYRTCIITTVHNTGEKGSPFLNQAEHQFASMDAKDCKLQLEQCKEKNKCGSKKSDQKEGTKK